jgi:inorganic pyrophosphatase
MPHHTSDEPPDALGDRAQGWVEVTIEIPRGSRNKHEFDHATGVFRLDRGLPNSG